MKGVILDGGCGTRINEEFATKPKPMIEIQGKSLIWYVMRNYYCFVFKEFIICTGYKGSMLHLKNQYYLGVTTLKIHWNMYKCRKIGEKQVLEYGDNYL